ncbi:MAG: rod shape-determining protein MreC [Desulfobulbaceae bacterium]|jgi:rod shape-determining protein MreC|nr:rod shape-determining protein MreC [Desulfobulbaceae bacterium]
MRARGGSKRNNGFRALRIVLFSGILLTLALIFLVSTLGTQRFGFVHKLVFEATAPVQSVFAGAAGYVNVAREEYLALFNVREENRRLWKALQESRDAANRNREALATNTRLRKLLEFKESTDLPMLAARIVGKDPSLWFRTVVVDRGSSDGVVKGMPVVDGDGVVGQVFSVSPNYSKVLLAIAPSSAIDVLLQKSRVRGILKGTGSLTYKLDYVLKTVDVQEGDHVVTAGYGGLFPTGMPVGVVSQVVRKRRGMFLDIEVTPTVDFLTLEDLLIIEREMEFTR